MPDGDPHLLTYLGDLINRQKQDIASVRDGAQERLAAAEALSCAGAGILKAMKRPTTSLCVETTG